MAPPRLASGLLSLPPILHMTAPSPIPGYSKAPRGLFVLPQVARVFTGTVISPSPPSRQWPSRSTIHAGRNLPDKGLRYLRTVRVTAAVHRGFRGVNNPLPSTRLFKLGKDNGSGYPLQKCFQGTPPSQAFPADNPHRTHCQFGLAELAPDTPDFPAYSQILQRPDRVGASKHKLTRCYHCQG